MELSNFNVRNRIRINRMFMLVTIFDKFTQLNLNQSLMGKGNEGNDITSNLMNTIFGLKTLPNDFRNDDNELANKCIELEACLERILNTADESKNLSRNDIIAFINHIENNGKPYFLKSQHLMYSSVMTLFCGYAFHGISKHELMQGIEYYKTMTFPFLPLNIKTMIKVLQEAERVFEEIQIKRTKRMMKREAWSRKLRLSGGLSL